MRKLAYSSRFEVTIAVFRTASILLAIYWSAIFVATHLPSKSLPQLSSDKFYHLLAFSGLSFLLAWTLPLGRRGLWFHLFVSTVIVLTYACVDEWSQQFAAGRQPDFYDIVADAWGCAIGLLAFMISRQIVWRMPWLHRVTRFQLTPRPQGQL